MSRLQPHVRTLAIVWAVCVLVLLGYVVCCAIGRTTHGFIAYYAAARLLVTGGFGSWVYDDPSFARYIQELTGTDVIEIFGPNAPTMALLAVPVAFFDPSTARTVWLVASLLGLALACWWLVRVAEREERRVHPLALVLALLSPAVFANLRTGQAYLLVFALLALAGIFAIQRRDTLAGVSAGLALALKSSGLPLLILFAAERRYRAILTALLLSVAAVALLLPWADRDIWWRYPAYVSSFLQRPAASVTAYQTTRSLFRHVCMADPEWNPLPAADCAALASIAPALLIVLAMGLTIAFAFNSRSELVVAAGVCLSVLAVPVGAEQHSALLGIPIVLLLQTSPSRPRLRLAQWLPWTMVAALLFVPLDVTALRWKDGWSALAAYPRLYAAWLVWGMTVYAMWRDEG